MLAGIIGDADGKAQEHSKSQHPKPMQLLPLTFNYDDLEPFLSRQSLQQHHNKHYRRHCENLGAEISGTRFANMSLREIILTSEGQLFQSAAQVWNHNFYWRCLTPRNGEEPSRELTNSIDTCFGSLASFKDQFKRAANRNLGSGWTWLVRAANGRLRIINTLNADTPLVDINTVPLLTIDIWEHAYYLDYPDDKPQYIDKFWNFVDWRFINDNFKKVEHHLL